MQEIFGSVRRSPVFRTPNIAAEDGGGSSDREEGTLVDRIHSCIRKSVFSKPSPPRLPPSARDNTVAVPPIRWRKGELIGCGTFGQVYMGLNLDSGELIAAKQGLIPPSSTSKEKTQVYIRELEEEVKLLKNLSHSNIVRYLGTVREEETLNILLEFVPGSSISSLGKFGSFPESGANILVDNKGCIKLADFGPSKQVV